MAKTRLQRFREREGLSTTELARRAGLSPRTVTRLESSRTSERRQVRQVTRWKVLNALNDARRDHQRPELSYEEVFPEDPDD
jgi:transcriptional regulator with XRE-family HTH domain